MSVAVGAYLVFGATQVGTPGPANMALMAVGARFGLRRALPFVAGVALGKQLIIWPMGFGLMEMARAAPLVFETLKWLSAGYIVWLAWRIAHLRLTAQQEDIEARPPGFLAGLAVHPLNPKAWAMITTGFTGFTTPGTPALEATATIAACLLSLQVVLHPLWTLAGAWIARALGGSRAESYLMATLAGLTIASVALVLFGGGE